MSQKAPRVWVVESEEGGKWTAGDHVAAYATRAEANEEVELFRHYERGTFRVVPYARVESNRRKR